MISIQTRRWRDIDPGPWVEIDQYFTYAEARPQMPSILKELGFEGTDEAVEKLDPMHLSNTGLFTIFKSPTGNMVRVLLLED
jgi:hypothetical protein